MTFLPPIPRIDEYTALLRERLPEKKVMHSLSVAETLVGVAEQIGATQEQCVTAGLLHDLFRAEKKDELLKHARAWDIPIERVYEEKPGLLHGPVAAEYARRELGIEDEDVYEAIYWHTTGRENLRRLGQGLYFADFSEPWRDYPEAAKAREILKREGFDKALVFVARAKTHYVKKSAILHPDTFNFYDWVQREFA